MTHTHILSKFQSLLLGFVGKKEKKIFNLGNKVLYSMASTYLFNIISNHADTSASSF